MLLRPRTLSDCSELLGTVVRIMSADNRQCEEQKVLLRGLQKLVDTDWLKGALARDYANNILCELGTNSAVHDLCMILLERSTADDLRDYLAQANPKLTSQYATSVAHLRTLCDGSTTPTAALPFLKQLYEDTDVYDALSIAYRLSKAARKLVDRILPVLAKRLKQQPMP